MFHPVSMQTSLVEEGATFVWQLIMHLNPTRAKELIKMNNLSLSHGTL